MNLNLDEQIILAKLVDLVVIASSADNLYIADKFQLTADTLQARAPHLLDYIGWLDPPHRDRVFVLLLALPKCRAKDRLLHEFTLALRSTPSAQKGTA